MNTSTPMNEFTSAAGDAMDQAKATANKAIDGTKATSSIISNEVKSFIADLEEIVSAKTGGSLEFGKLKSDINKRLGEYKSSLEDAGKQVAAQAKQKADAVNGYVHEEPWKAIAAGFGLGLLLGVVISRR